MYTGATSFNARLKVKADVALRGQTSVRAAVDRHFFWFTGLFSRGVIRPVLANSCCAVERMRSIEDAKDYFVMIANGRARQAKSSRRSFSLTDSSTYFDAAGIFSDSLLSGFSSMKTVSGYICKLPRLPLPSLHTLRVIESNMGSIITSSPQSANKASFMAPITRNTVSSCIHNLSSNVCRPYIPLELQSYCTVANPNGTNSTK